MYCPYAIALTAVFDEADQWLNSADWTSKVWHPYLKLHASRSIHCNKTISNRALRLIFYLAISANGTSGFHHSVLVDLFTKVLLLCYCGLLFRWIPTQPVTSFSFDLVYTFLDNRWTL
jgi:hypothetical protein